MPWVVLRPNGTKGMAEVKSAVGLSIVALLVRPHWAHVLLTAIESV
jgi:hypothetical protein